MNWVIDRGDRRLRGCEPRAPGADAAALLLLMALIALRWWPEIGAPGARRDERFYLAAFELARDGRSPFEEPRYYYPAAVARAGGLLLDRLGPGAALAALRLLQLGGLALTLWLAVASPGIAWAGLCWRRRLLLAAALALLLPAVRASVASGNLSAAASGLVLAGLRLWPRRAAAAGVLLGLSVALKPIGPVAILLLGAHRPAAGGRRHLVAAALAILLAALLLLAPGDVGGLLGQEIERVTATRVLSVHRALGALGLPLHPAVPTALVAAAGAVLARRRTREPFVLLCFAVSAVILAAPAVWRHTLLVTLPIQVAAVALALSRLTFVRNPRQRRFATGTGERPGPGRSDPPAPSRPGRALFGRAARRLRVYELLLVLAAVAAIQFAHGGGIDDRAPLLQALLLALPCLAPAVLTAYLSSRGAAN